MKRKVIIKYTVIIALAALLVIDAVFAVLATCKMSDAVSKTDELFLEYYGKMIDVLTEDFEAMSSDEQLDAYARLRSYANVSSDLKQYSSYADNEKINKVFVSLANHNKPKEKIPEDVHLLLLEQLRNMDSKEISDKAAAALQEYFKNAD